LIFSFLSIFAVMYSISRISLNINLTIFVTIAIFWGFWDVFGHLYRVTLALPFLIVLMTQSILYDQLKLRWVMISSAIHLSYYFFFTRLIFRKNDLISLVLALIAPAILLLLAFNFFAFFLGERSTLYSPNEATSFRISYIHFYIALTAIFFSFYANNSWRYWFFLSVAGFIISIFGFEVIAERSVLLFTLISSFALNSYLTFMSLKVKLIYFWFATIYFTYRAINYDQHEGYESIFEYFSYSEPFNLFSGILYNFIKMALL